MENIFSSADEPEITDNADQNDLLETDPSVAMDRQSTDWDPLTEAVVAVTEDKIQTNVDEEQQSMSPSPFPPVPATTSQHQHQPQQQEQMSKSQMKTQEKTVAQYQPLDFLLLRVKFEKWVRQQLISFYTKHNPSKLESVDNICKKYRGREKTMLHTLYTKYNVPVPDALRARLSSPEAEDTVLQDLAVQKAKSVSRARIDSETRTCAALGISKKLSFRGKRMSMAAERDKNVFLQGITELRYKQFVRGDVVLEGYLSKRSDWVRSWNTRWFALFGNSLVYYDHAADAHNARQAPRKSLRLTKGTSIQGRNEELFTILIQAPHRDNVWLKAADSGEHSTWVDALTRTIEFIKRYYRERAAKRRPNREAVSHPKSLSTTDTDAHAGQSTAQPTTEKAGAESTTQSPREGSDGSDDNEDDEVQIGAGSQTQPQRRRSARADSDRDGSVRMTPLRSASRSARSLTASALHREVDRPEHQERWGVDAHVERLLTTPSETEGLKLVVFLSQWRRQVRTLSGKEPHQVLLQSLKSCVADIHDHFFDIVWTDRYDDDVTYCQVYRTTLRVVLHTVVAQLAVYVSDHEAAKDADIIDQVYALREGFSVSALARLCGVSPDLPPRDSEAPPTNPYTQPPGSTLPRKRAADTTSGARLMRRWAPSIHLINAAHDAQMAPLQQVSLLHQSLRTISELRSSSGQPVSADDIVPIFYFCVLMSRMRRPSTMICILTGLLDSKRIEGELMYAVTSFEAALYFIQHTLRDALTSKSTAQLPNGSGESS